MPHHLWPLKRGDGYVLLVILLDKSIQSSVHQQLSIELVNEDNNVRICTYCKNMQDVPINLMHAFQNA